MEACFFYGRLEIFKALLAAKADTGVTDNVGYQRRV